jgi:HlyD family secretion protein
MDISRILRHKAVVSVVTIAVIAGVAAIFFWPKKIPLAQQYETAPVQKGDLTQTVSANGTLNPVVLVNVGTQVSGVVRKIYADFNDKVKQGQILLELDPSLLQAQLDQSQANMANARASLALAEANEKRTRELYAKQYVAKQDLDTAVEAAQTAKAQLALSKAQVERDRVNLSYSIIRSPVSGVVVSRDIDVGQTVAASFQTPELFKIAQDLTHMQIDSSFAEADIGGIRVGQTADFTVDAFPGRRFSGKVRQIRLNPTVQSNVVTYDVVINVNNPKGDLLPGMTAYVNVTTAHLKDVLSVPNAALRFRPAKDALVQKEETGRERPKGEEGIRGTVYVLGSKGLIPVALILGATDGNRTQVLAGDLQEGEAVVIDTASNAGTASHSPHIRIH